MRRRVQTIFLSNLSKFVFRRAWLGQRGLVFQLLLVNLACSLNKLGMQKLKNINNQLPSRAWGRLGAAKYYHCGTAYQPPRSEGKSTILTKDPMCTTSKVRVALGTSTLFMVTDHRFVYCTVQFLPRLANIYEVRWKSLDDCIFASR